MYQMLTVCQVLLDYFKPLIFSVIPFGCQYYSFTTIILTTEA